MGLSRTLLEAHGAQSHRVELIAPSEETELGTQSSGPERATRVLEATACAPPGSGGQPGPKEGDANEVETETEAETETELTHRPFSIDTSSQHSYCRRIRYALHGFEEIVRAASNFLNKSLFREKIPLAHTPPHTALPFAPEPFPCLPFSFRLFRLPPGPCPCPLGPALQLSPPLGCVPCTCPPILSPPAWPDALVCTWCQGRARSVPCNAGHGPHASPTLADP